MTPGDLEFVQVIASWAVAAPIVVAVVRFDEKRLRGTALARSWPPSSRDAAIFTMWMLGFHPLYVLAFFLVHFVRTRGGVRGVELALTWSTLTIAGAIWAQVAAAVAVDVSEP